MKPFYERDGITLLLGDCLEILPTMEAGSFDAVVTDPPYGVGIDYGSDSFRDTFAEWESLMIVILPHLVRVSTGGVFVSTSKFEAEHWFIRNSKTPPVIWRLCWFKGAADTRSPIGWKDWESVFVLKKPKRQMHDHFYVGAGSNQIDRKILHPCPKPDGWAWHLIEKGTTEGDSILDPFAGSGTTGVAAWRSGRKCTLIEISEEYCEIAAKRIDAEISRGRLFEPEPEPIEQATLEWES